MSKSRILFLFVFLAGLFSLAYFGGEAGNSLSAAPAQASGVAQAAAPAGQEAEDQRVLIGPYQFDPLSADLTAVQSLAEVPTNAKQQGLFLLQFDGPPTDAKLAAAQDLGLTFVQYIPTNAYVVWTTPSALAQVEQLAEVRWTGSYFEEMRSSPQMRAEMDRMAADDVPSAITVGVFLIDDGSLPALEAMITAGGGVVNYRSQAVVMDESFPAERWNITLSGSALRQLAAWPSLFVLEEYLEAEAHDPHSAGVQAVSLPINYKAWLPDTGYDGTGVRVAILDTGVDWDHPDLNVVSGTELNAAYSEAGQPGSDGLGHGTHVAGIVAGSGVSGFGDTASTPFGLGIAPGASLHAADFIQSGKAADVGVRAAYNAGSDLSNNSYGAAPGAGYTDWASAIFDGFVLDVNPNNDVREPFTMVFSAGNDGNGKGGPCVPVGPKPCRFAMGPWAEAKNVITVGSTDSPHMTGPNYSNNPYGNWGGVPGIQASWPQNISTISNFSTRGPAKDDRIKPDVVGLGGYIISTRNAFVDPGPGAINDGCQNTTGLSNLHSWCGGTSMSSPSVAGVAALFTQFWHERVGDVSLNPEPATVKAALIATATRMAGRHLTQDGHGNTFTKWPNEHEGWGQVNAGRLLDPEYPILYYENPAILSDTGQSWRVSVKPVNPNFEMKVVLVWSDPPAMSGFGTNNPALVNDLDLTMSRPGSNVDYCGNDFNTNGYWANWDCSDHGSQKDSKNNVEVILFYPQNEDNGAEQNKSYDILVKAAKIAGDGVRENDDISDQNFSVVCINCVEAYYVDDSVDDGLVAYWKFDEAAGTQVINSAGSGFGLNLTNGVHSLTTLGSPAKFLNYGSLLMSGGDRIIGSADPAFEPADEFSIAMWAKPISLPGPGQRHVLISKCCANNGGYFISIDELGRVVFNMLDTNGASIGVISPSGIPVNTWSHIAVTWSKGGYLRVYINGGVERGKVFAGTAPLKPTTSPLEIGYLYNGFLDEVRFYKHKLSQSDVTRLSTGDECETSGVSWSEAFRFVTCGLTKTWTNGGEVRVAEGTYSPGSNRQASFVVTKNTKVLGGYDGKEGNTRSWQAYQTILSGDLDRNDGAGINGLQGRNSYHVVQMGDSATLDGFIVQNGLANDPNGNDEGAGISSYSAVDRRWNNLIVRNNLALKGGGGLKSWGAGRLRLYQVAFLGNKGATGGGADIRNGGGVLLVNTIFSGNKADVAAGLIYNNNTTNGSLDIFNSTFSGNAASYYGGIGVISNPQVSIFSSIFYGNTAALDPQFHLPASGVSVTNSIIEGGYGGDNNLASDPLFADPDGEDNIPGTIDDNLHLTRNSPAIDTGGTCTGFDFAGMKRPFDGNFDKTGVCDRGAYEYGTILVVDDDGETPGELGYVIAGLQAKNLAYEVWTGKPSAERLSGHSRVVWFTGAAFDQNGGIGPGGASETAVSNWLDKGPRCMLLSSRNYLTSHGAPGAFAQNYFGLDGTTFVINKAYSMIWGIGQIYGGQDYPLLSKNPYFSNSNDMVSSSAALGSESAFDVKENGNVVGQAGVMLRNNQFRTMFLGFPLAQISSHTDESILDRGTVLEQFFANCEPVLTTNSNGSLALGVGVDKSIVSAVGEGITYTYVITNTGDSAASGPFSVVDSVAGETNPCGANSLPLGGATSCTANYSVTQADLDAGIISNTAQAFGGLGIKSKTAGATVVADPSEIGLVVKTDKETFEQVGEIMVFTYTIHNQHDAALAGPFKIEDAGVGTINDCGSGPLAPGEVTSCQKGYTVTQADIDGGSFVSLATASGNGFTSRPQITWPNHAVGELALEVTAEPQTYNLVGDEIIFTYAITNEGTAVLNGPFSINDETLGTINNCGSATLNPGAETTCQKSYTVTQEDINAGAIAIKATVSGDGQTSPEANLNVALGVGSLALQMSANRPSFKEAGEEIVYTYVIENVSGVPISGPFSISDDTLGSITPCGSGPLDPGETTSCQGVYTVTAEDKEAGSITNFATASGNLVTSPHAALTILQSNLTFRAQFPLVMRN